MPTYEFTCPKGHDFDKFFRSMASAPMVVACPVCGEPADRKVSAGAGLVFRGSGFYITDYGKDGKKDQKSATSRTSESRKETSSDARSADPAPSGSSSGSGASERPSEAASGTSSDGGSKASGDSAPKTTEAPARSAAPPKASE